MDTNRPLQNPTVNSFEAPTLEQPADMFTDLQNQQPSDLSLIPAVTQKDKKQLSFGLGTRFDSIKRGFGTFRSNLKKKEIELELLPYWRHIAPALALVTGTFLVLGSGATAIILFNDLQPRIPFYYNAFEEHWEQVDKVILLILPVIFFITILILLRFAYEVHKYDPRLSKSINMILSVLNLLFMIALTQIYSLIAPVN